MSKTLVIGANGKIGRRLVARLARAGLPVRAMLRSDAQRPDLEALGAEVVIGDLEGEFEQALDGCDKVVFTAGSGGHTGPDKTFTVDLWGALKTIRACEEKHIPRYIMVSARNAGDPDSGPAARRPYLIAKHLADEALQRSDLQYTILRPGKLTEDPGTGRVRTTRPEPDDQYISRDDVAEAIVFCLQNDATVGKIVLLFHGDTPIADALGSEA
jgi:uncharacterized protein YbjT (DUF2867 family)